MSNDLPRTAVDGAGGGVKSWREEGDNIGRAKYCKKK
jgi:hypothetical protein